jgi:hypothetical protein
MIGSRQRFHPPPERDPPTPSQAAAPTPCELLSSVFNSRSGMIGRRQRPPPLQSVTHPLLLLARKTRGLRVVRSSNMTLLHVSASYTGLITSEHASICLCDYLAQTAYRGGGSAHRSQTASAVR